MRRHRKHQLVLTNTYFCDVSKLFERLLARSQIDRNNSNMSTSFENGQTIFMLINECWSLWNMLDSTQRLNHYQKNSKTSIMWQI